MQKITQAELVQLIKKLKEHTNQPLPYPSGTGWLVIHSIAEPHGPIKIKTLDAPDQDPNEKTSRNISVNQLATMASALRPYHPIDVEVLYHASGNTRSALETLLLYTPNIFLCYPGRTDIYTGEIREGVKHIMWCPDESHPTGEIETKNYEGVIAELEASYQSIEIPQSVLDTPQFKQEFDSIDAKRTHTRMQIALAQIGHQLGLKTWIAKNDQRIEYGDGTLLDLPDVVQSLDDIIALPTPEIKEASALIDALWYKPSNVSIPAIFEVEHSTGVMSGLARMAGLVEKFDMIRSARFVIVAPDTLKQKVMNEVNRDIFSHLNAQFLPYTALQHLYAIMQKYENLPQFVGSEFLYGFLQDVKS